MNRNNEVPRKPHLSVWLFSFLLLLGGLRWLYMFLKYGFITVSRVNTGERYTGSLAVFVIGVTLAVGLLVLGSAIRLWWLFKKGQQREAGP